jgi:hypothetical protein
MTLILATTNPILELLRPFFVGAAWFAGIAAILLLALFFLGRDFISERQRLAFLGAAVCMVIALGIALSQIF